jgi:predicted acetyltransferase
VGVPPEQRAGGIGLAFMRGVLHEYRERGFLTAALYPFRGSFYRRAGYEFGGRRTLITCPPSAMAKVEAPLRVRRLDSSEFEQIRSCYVGFASKHSGVNLRNENQWFRHLGREKPFTVYAVGDPIEGYVALRLVSGFWETQELEELVWSSSAGYLSLMSLIRSFGINQSLLSWHEPSDSPFLARFDEKGVKAESDRQIMWRAVNVPNSLRALKPDASGEVSIRVHDADLPENEGPWKARFGLEGVEVERASEADIEIDIRPFSQALMGEPSFATVLAQGRATVKTAEAAKAMNGLLPPRTTYCLDFF